MPQTDKSGSGARILLVGHCGVDGPRLQRALSKEFGGAAVERINSSEDLNQALDGGADRLLLVNREPVGFEESGLEIIREVRKTHPDAKVMLVSDYPEAQEEAERIGAVKGFGKSKMDSPEMARVVGEALASHPGQDAR